MNIHDKAHDLARSLSGSEEYQEFLKAVNALEASPEAKQMVQDFMAKQIQIEYDVLAGKGENKEAIEQIQKMYEILMINPTAKEFLESHMRFQRIIGDVYKIIGDSIAEGMKFLVK